MQPTLKMGFTNLGCIFCDFSFKRLTFDPAPSKFNLHLIIYQFSRIKVLVIKAYFLNLHIVYKTSDSYWSNKLKSSYWFREGAKRARGFYWSMKDVLFVLLISRLKIKKTIFYLSIFLKFGYILVKDEDRGFNWAMTVEEISLFPFFILR